MHSYCFIGEWSVGGLTFDETSEAVIARDTNISYEA